MHGCARESRRRQRRRGRAAVAPWLAAALALAGAEADAQIAVEVLSTPIEAGKFAFLDVECPPDSVAIGGGTQVSDPGDMDLVGNGPLFGAQTLLQRPDGPGGAPSGWRGYAENQSGADGTLHVGALCAANIPVSTVVASVSVTSGTFAGATAECPEDSVAIGGGAALGGLTMRITETGPRLPQSGPLGAVSEGVYEAPDAWTVFARNPGGGSPLLKVAALCADLDGPNVSTHVASRNVMANGGLAGGEVECPAGATGLGGGLASLNPLDLTVTSSAPWFAGDEPELAQQPDGTSPTPIGWDSRGRNDSPDVLSVKRAAVCLPEPSSLAASLTAASVLAGLARARGARSRARNAHAST